MRIKSLVRNNNKAESMIKYVVSVFLLLSFAIELKANLIKGIVQDAYNKKAIVLAKVDIVDSCLNQHWSGYTDAVGYFIFEVAGGCANYFITVTADSPPCSSGYYTFKKGISSGIDTVKINMIPKPEDHFDIPSMMFSENLLSFCFPNDTSNTYGLFDNDSIVDALIYARIAQFLKCDNSYIIVVHSQTTKNEEKAGNQSLAIIRGEYVSSCISRHGVPKNRIKLEISDSDDHQLKNVDGTKMTDKGAIWFNFNLGKGN